MISAASVFARGIRGPTSPASGVLDLDRYVRKGEKAIKILARRPSRSVYVTGEETLREVGRTVPAWT